MSKDNLKLWNEVKQPPKSALKEIKGGRLKGMTDINPMWRFEEMTRQFGRCGEGWHFCIDDNWTENGADGVKMVFVIVSIYIGDESTKPIVGMGGSTIVANERSGLHNNDEGFKMAVTDALSTAMKMLGFGADVYAGKWDGSKYKETDPKIPVKADGEPIPKPTPVSRGQEEYEALDENEKVLVNEKAQKIRDYFKEGSPESKEDAYTVYFNLNSDMRMALWYLLQPQSAIRRVLKQMHDKKTNYNEDVPQ